MNKIFIFIFAALAIAAPAFADYIAAVQPTGGNSDGTGTYPSNPAYISSAGQLQWIADSIEIPSVRNSYYVMTEDIIFPTDGSTLKPIGTYNNPFYGIFDGKGHKISGLKINESSETDNEVGLFGAVSSYDDQDAQDVIIRNLELSDVEIIGGEGSVGGLVGIVDGNLSIENVAISGSVQGAWVDLGGLIGNIYYGNVSLKNSYSTAQVKYTGSQTTCVGGLIGNIYYSDSSNIKNVYAVEAPEVIEGISPYVGTLIGCNRSDIQICGAVYPEGFGDAIGDENGSLNCQISGVGTTIAKTTNEMKIENTYSALDIGWDFDNIWSIDGEINNGFPILPFQQNNNFANPALRVNATFSPSEFTFNGLVRCPDVTEVNANSVELTYEDDYTTECINNTNAGMATLKISAVSGSGYSGSKDTTFIINPQSLFTAILTINPEKEYSYLDLPVCPEASDFELKFEETQLGKDVDFYFFCQNSNSAGTGTLVTMGKGNYTGTQSTSFEIKKVFKSLDEFLDGAQEVNFEENGSEFLFSSSSSLGGEGDLPIVFDAASSDSRYAEAYKVSLEAGDKIEVVLNVEEFDQEMKIYKHDEYSNKYEELTSNSNSNSYSYNDSDTLKYEIGAQYESGDYYIIATTKLGLSPFITGVLDADYSYDIKITKSKLSEITAIDSVYWEESSVLWTSESSFEVQAGTDLNSLNRSEIKFYYKNNDVVVDSIECYGGWDINYGIAEVSITGKYLNENCRPKGFIFDSNLVIRDTITFETSTTGNIANTLVELFDNSTGITLPQEGEITGTITANSLLQNGLLQMDGSGRGYVDAYKINNLKDLQYKNLLKLKINSSAENSVFMCVVSADFQKQYCAYPNIDYDEDPGLAYSEYSFVISDSFYYIAAFLQHYEDELEEEISYSLFVEILDGLQNGNGTVQSPYEISSARDLQLLNLYLSKDLGGMKYFKLTQDIDLTEYLSESGDGYNNGAGWQPVNFYGMLNGNGKKITGLWINRPEKEKVGLFSTIASNSKVENLGVVIDGAKGGVVGSYYVGGLAGSNDYGTISNSYVNGNVNGGGNVGGLVGNNSSGTFSNSYVSGSISGSGGDVGGLVGNNYSGTFSNSYVSGSISGSGGDVGGLVGRNSSGTFSNSYVSGSISGSGGNVGGSGNVGGLVGSNNYSGTFSNSYFNSELAGINDANSRTTAQMKLKNTFVGWDFENVWEIVEGKLTPNLRNNPNPKLSRYTITYESPLGTEHANPVYYTYEDTIALVPPAERTGYTFGGWYDNENFTGDVITGISINSTGDTTLYAKWDINKYEILFVNGADTLQMDTLDYGFTPEYEGEAPTKESTAEYAYSFIEWAPVVVTKDTVYEASFDSTVNKYEILFVNGADTLQMDTLDYGSTPEYEGDAPTKESTAEYAYSFIEWAPVVVTKDTVYEASFDSTVNKYEILFVNGADTLQMDTLDYGSTPEYEGDAPTKESTAEYAYSFIEWAPVVVTKDTVYEASFDSTVNKYEILFVNGADTLQRDTLNYGSIPAYKGKSPTKESSGYTYQFSGWGNIVAVSKDTAYAAQFVETPITFTLTYKNLGGQANANTNEFTVANDEIQLAPLANRTGYTFAYWSNEDGEEIETFSPAGFPRDYALTAVWTPISYNAILNFNYSNKSSDTITYTIESETQFQIPERSNYAFLGWLDSSGRVTKGISKGDTGNKIFTASWKQSKFSITLDAGEAATVNPSTINVNYGEQIGDIPVPAKLGYSFVEWRRLDNDKKYDSKIYLEEDDITLYAEWKPIEYVICLNPSGGAVSPLSVAVYNGEEIGSLPTPELAGFSFAGWFNKEGTLKFNYATEFNLDDGIDTLFARYIENIPDTATITFNAGEGTVEQISKTVINGMPLGVLPLPVPNNQLKVFAGWFVLVGADSVEWNSATIYNKSGGVTELHAHYADNIYTITLDPSGGYFVIGLSGETQSVFEKNVLADSLAGALPVPFKKGFIFSGYKTADNALFSFKSKVVSDTTIYADWIPAYSIVLDPNGGTLPDSVKIVPVGYAAGVLPFPERMGYAFDGWWLNDSTRFFGTEPSNSLEPIYIFANWVQNAPLIHTVHFEPGDGKLDAASLERKVTYGHSLGTLPIPSLIGSRFIGWFTLPQGGAADDDENSEWIATDPYNLSTDLVLFAHYATIEEEENEPLANNAKLFAVGDPITVKLDARNGKDTVVRQGLEGVSIGSLHVPAYDGHEFSGWFTKASGGSEVRSSTKFLTDTTVYAHWYAVPIEVSLKAGEGASVAFDVLYLERGLEVGYIPDPERSGYYFDGWFDSASGGSRYSYATIYKNTSVDTLYAHWTEIPYVVSLNARGGEVNPNTLETRQNSAIGYLPDPNRNRYSFAGWLGNGDEQYYPSTLAQDDSLNAMWLANVPNAKEIYLNAGNGTLAAGKDKWVVAKGYEIGYLPIPSPEDGWNFSGWFDSAYGGSQYTYATIYKNSSIETLYARYIPVPWEIVLNAGEGGSVNPAVVKVARNAALPDDFVAVGILPEAKKPGYAFDGWFKGDVEYLASAKIGANDTLTARYAPQYALYLNRNAPKAYLKDSLKYVVEGRKIGVLSTPERSDYMFAGWHTDSVGGNLITADSIYRWEKDDTLYAHWDTLPPNAYLISFKMQGGTMDHPEKKAVLFKRAIGELPVPARTDYTFKGWWTNVSGGSQYGESTVYGLEGNIYLFARWEKVGSGPTDPDDPTPIIPPKPPIISGGDKSDGESGGNGAYLGIAGESSAQAIYYDLKGAPLGESKPKHAGVYILKTGSAVKMIVVR